MAEDVSKLTYNEIISEINKIKKELGLYNKKDPALPSDFVYKTAILKLNYLRNLKRKYPGNSDTGHRQHHK
jgi:hypothetical protein